jgi:hypothetical protein
MEDAELEMRPSTRLRTSGNFGQPPELASDGGNKENCKLSANGQPLDSATCAQNSMAAIFSNAKRQNGRLPARETNPATRSHTPGRMRHPVAAFFEQFPHLCPANASEASHQEMCAAMQSHGMIPVPDSDDEICASASHRTSLSHRGRGGLEAATCAKAGTQSGSRCTRHDIEEQANKRQQSVHHLDQQGNTIKGKRSAIARRHSNVGQGELLEGGEHRQVGAQSSSSSSVDEGQRQEARQNSAAQNHQEGHVGQHHQPRGAARLAQPGAAKAPKANRADGQSSASEASNKGTRTKTLQRKQYTEAQRSAATPFIAKLMEAADFDSNVTGGAAAWRSLMQQALTLAPADQKRNVNEVVKIFKPKTKGLHGCKLDELISSLRTAA